MSIKQEDVINLRSLMDRFKIYIPYFQEYGMNAELIPQIIKEHEVVRAQMLKMRSRYEASKEGIPILTRTIPYADPDRVDSIVNNKLNNSFDSDIIDTKVGYFLGHPISYVVTDANENEKKRLDKLRKEMENMRIRDNLPDKDATIGKRSSIGGYGARLSYIALENDKPIVRIANKRGEDCVFFYYETMAEPQYAMEYYTTTEISADGTSLDIQVADFYDSLYMHRYINRGDGYVAEPPFLHGFNLTPLYGLENDDELNAEVQKILNLTIAYDRALSDASNEIEASRLALLILSNLELSDEDIQRLKSAGVLEVRDGLDKKATAQYLTKDVNDTMLENHLVRLDKNIMRFGKTVNFSDEQFASNLSGVAIAFKTMALENKAIIAENKMRSMLHYQMKLVCSAWAKLGICRPEDYLKVWFGFKRNLPRNIKEEAEATAILKGNVSERTRLSLLSFIDNVEEEELEMERDREKMGGELEEIENFTDTASDKDDVVEGTEADVTDE